MTHAVYPDMSHFCLISIFLSLEILWNECYVRLRYLQGCANWVFVGNLPLAARM